MKEVHIGPLPPVINGISVYLYRLSKLRKNALYIDWNEISDIRKFIFWSIKQAFTFKKKNYIFHPPSLNQKIILYLLSCLSIHKFSLVIHGNPLLNQYNQSGILMRTLLRKVLNKAYFIQVINPAYKEFLRRVRITNNNIFIKHAFLPPPLEEETKILKKYEEEVFKFLDERNPIIISNAAALLFYNGFDLYGLDMCIELANLLVKDLPNLGFLFALANEKLNEHYFKKMKRKVKKYKLEKNFYFLIGQELWPILKRADLMIRATNRDGYASSVAEALYFNCPAIASNVCKRSTGAILFNNRDLNDLYIKSIKLLTLNRRKKKAV